MSNTIDHMCINILYKNLNDPGFKDYYTLEEINDELNDYEDSKIATVFEADEKVKRVYFHMNYRDYVSTLRSYKFSCLADASVARTRDFVKMAMVV